MEKELANQTQCIHPTFLGNETMNDSLEMGAADLELALGTVLICFAMELELKGGGMLGCGPYGMIPCSHC